MPEHDQLTPTPTPAHVAPVRAGTLKGQQRLAWSQVVDVISSDGQALDQETQAVVEHRFGRDFSQVRVHTDATAAASAEAVGAAAYTYGHDIVFNRDQYAPHLSRGLGLLAHELAHVTQQSRGRGASDTVLDRCGLEDDADKASRDIARPGRTVAVAGTAAPHLARQDKDRTANQRAAQSVVTRPVRRRHTYRKSPCATGTGIGHFDEVEYNAETREFTVTVRPTFHFLPFRAADYPREVREDPKALRNAEQVFAQKNEAFIGSFVRQAESWGGHHVFYCHEPPLIGAHATVRVDVDLTYAKSSPSASSISTTNVTVIEKHEGEHTHGSGSMVVELDESVGWRYDSASNAMVPESVGPFEIPPGLGEGGSVPGGLPGLPRPRPAALDKQLSLAHELGHVFGLGDEYVQKSKAGYGRGDPAQHSALAASMLHMTVEHGGDNAMIMAQGMEIRPQHGVTFLAALRDVTGLRWEFDPPS